MRIRVTTTGIQAVTAVLRDIALWIGGLLGIAYQQVTGHISIELLLVYMGMIGIPGAVGIVKLSRGKGETLGTVEPLSGSRPSSSSRPPSSPLGDGET